MPDPTTIGFVTLFLGLTSGPWPVTVMTAPVVASAEIHLDGAAVATLRGEPWSATVDFGPDLEPHQLTVVGFDSAGHETGRTTQWVNMPQPDVLVDVVLERDARGRVVAARVGWASKQGIQPAELEAELDGTRLEVAALDRIPLPSIDMARAHVLRVSLAFGAVGDSTREVVLGGTVGGEVSAELTAVPALLRKATDQVSAEQLQGLLQVGGKAARVVAVEKGPVTLAMVVDSAAQERLQATGMQWAVGERRKGLYSVEGRDRLFLVDSRPGAAMGPSQRPASVFPTRVFPDVSRFALPGILASLTPFPESPVVPRLAEAVAVAGILAAGGQGRRAVVLVVGSEVARADLQRSARFLSALGVPLHVWSLGSEAPDARAGVGGVWREVCSGSRCHPEWLGEANAELQRDVSRQLLVWIEGTHRPQDVTLAGGGPLVGLVR